MKRPNWIPYTPSAVNILLDEYKEYADHMEAALARERESVNELGEANIKLRETLKDLIEVIELEDLMTPTQKSRAVEAAKKAMEDSDGRP